MMRDPKLLERAFRAVEQAAVEGRRCPENGTGDVLSGTLPALARAGRIRIKVYAHNYRVVEILTGPHKGKQTKPQPPQYQQPYKIIDAAGTHTRCGSPLPRSQDRQPSAPRPLSREELS